MPYLAIEFTTEEDIDRFMSWLDNQGEQDYWEWLEIQGQQTNKIEYDYKKKFITITNKEE